MSQRKRVIVGMSGGVDSSVTAALLVEQGYDVVGITLNLWPEIDGAEENPREDACCALGAVEDARRVADRLGIRYYVMNFRDIFEEKVVKDFIGEYSRGRTPNPCVRCNQFIKFDALLARCAQFGADYVATGHYVRVEHDAALDRWQLRKAADPSKDQSYVLYVMTQDRLARALFPLGALSKAETRALAEQWKLPVARKPESQDICFVPYKRYTEFLEKHAPETLQEGPIVDAAGQRVGTHKGIALHTVGQRRGLGMVAQEPRYVTGLDAATNTVMIGTLDDLQRAECTLDDMNWVRIAAPHEPIRTYARIRYRSELAPATVYAEPGSRARVVFDEPQRAVTPGQAVVFYDGEYVVGGGTIEN
ncbi:MAG: tRNA 2-thiouridine(34) synthase MnmA [Chloroflexi bacterium]|nr:tRNA 2-thiouridine(34) synthase MnmA [Chloroflexota bacterium]